MKYLLEEKADEHGDWELNRYAIQKLTEACIAICQKADASHFSLRDDYPELSMMIVKFGRILTAPENPDNPKDLAGYASLLHNKQSDKEQIDLLIKPYSS